MKRFAMFLVTVLLVGWGPVQSATAAAPAWETDKAHTYIYFTVDHIFSKVRGSFGEYEAMVSFDPQDLAGSSFAFEIQVDSIDTNISKRDKHLLSADFFDAANFPVITFTSTAITDAGNGLYQVAGKLNIMGKEHDFILPLVLAGVKDHPAMADKVVAGFNGTVVVDRLALGVGSGKFYEMGVVGKDVEILVTMEVLKAK